MIDLKQPENVEYCIYLCSLITNVARGTRDIKFRIVMAKAVLNKKKILFTSKLETSEVLHLQHGFLWC